MQVLGSPTPIATKDTYDPTLTIEQDTADTLSFLVANASAVVRLRAQQRRGGAALPYGPELLINPQASPPIKNVSGATFRSAVAGQPALVIAQLVGPEDPQIAGGTPFMQTLSASGQASQVGVITKMALASFPPAAPADGTLIQIVLNANGDEWLVAYNASTGYWDFLGGSTLYSEVVTPETMASLTYVPLATAGPSIALPRPGDYYVETGFRLSSETAVAVNLLMSYDIAATAAADADAARSTVSAVQFTESVHRRRLKTGLAALTTLVAKYRTDTAGTFGFADRWMGLTPRRIQ